MFRSSILYKLLKYSHRIQGKRLLAKSRHYTPVTIGLLSTVVYCDDKRKETDVLWEEGGLEHEFLIRQATTINVNAATQLLTVTLVAIQDTSERLREALTREICLVNQALEWGDEGTPPHHWDQLVAVRGTLCDLKHNLRTLLSYMDYAEKLATVAAEISYLSGNIAASDAICERIDHACRTCNAQKQLTNELQQESLELQQQAILNSPQLKDKLNEEVKHDRRPEIRYSNFDKIRKVFTLSVIDILFLASFIFNAECRGFYEPPSPSSFFANLPCPPQRGWHRRRGYGHNSP